MLNMFFLGRVAPEALLVATEVVLGLVSIECGRKSGWLFWGKVVVSKPVLATDVFYFFKSLFTFSGASVSTGALSDRTFNADVRAMLLTGRRQACENYILSLGGRFLLLGLANNLWNLRDI